MTMVVTISPSRRDVSPAEQLRRSPRLVLPRFHLETEALRPKSFLLIFFQGKRHLIPEDGHQGASRWPTRQGRALHPRGQWVAPLWCFLRPIFLIYSKTDFHVVSGLLELCRIGRSLIFAPFPTQNSSCRHSPSLCKPCKIRENRHKYCDIMYNNSP